MVICLEQGADLHKAQLMPLPLTVSCFSTVQIGYTFLVPAHPGSPVKRAVKRVCVCSKRTAVHLRNLVRDNARNSARCTKASKATLGLDGQHEDVDRTLHGRVNQNDRGQG